jgi:hypothetical protein
MMNERELIGKGLSGAGEGSWGEYGIARIQAAQAFALLRIAECLEAMLDCGISAADEPAESGKIGGAE